MKATTWILRGACLALIVSFALALPAAAQTPGATTPQGQPLKIAVINGDRALAESNIGSAVQAQAQEAAADWDTRIRDKQAEIDALVAQAQEQRLTLTEEALARIQQQIEQLNVELQRLQDDAQRAMNRMAQDAQDQINAVLIPAVEQLATAEGYDLILDTRIQGILYFADAIDATDEFIAMVNAQTPAPDSSQWDGGEESRR
jgi:outer membrane protein